MKKLGKTITYVFLQGRKQRLESSKLISKEFFYSYFYAKENFDNVNIVEMENFEKNIKQSLLRKLDSFINKLTKLPIYTYAIFKKKNLDVFNKSDFIIMANDRVAFSCFPLIILSKRKNKNISFFVMGLFNKDPRFKIQLTLRNLLIKSMFKKVNKIFFLGKKEYKHAIENFNKFEEKFVFLPFSIDTSFWKPEEGSNFENKKDILFIGNDGNRDYKFVIDLAARMHEYNFHFITEKIDKNQKLSKNINLIEGSWGLEQLTDEEIREYYIKSKITIIPIKETNQPSGQSVALQSMSTGTPVILTKVEGFWDEENFHDKKHLSFIKENKLDEWENLINDIYNNKEKYEYLSENGKKSIHSMYNIDKFDEIVFKSIGLRNE